MTYQEEQIGKLQLELTKIRQQLPDFCSLFLTGIEDKAIKTRILYAKNLNMFFTYLRTKLDKNILTINDLNNVKSTDIEQFLSYLSEYTTCVDGKEKTETNTAQGKKSKLCSIKALYTYLYKHEFISKNIASFVDMPEIKEKSIVRLEGEEITNFKNAVKKDKTNSNRVRDTAILNLFLGTGLRISELVGINITDIDLINNSVMVTRKGDHQQRIYLSEDAVIALKKYLDQRVSQEDALFISKLGRRISTAEVGKIVRKYGKQVTDKNITPHKLRSTYGTELYKQTGDIYLVANNLGHKDVNTTRDHYAAMEEERRKQAAKNFKI
jgi:site-specific recombinase XerD